MPKRHLNANFIKHLKPQGKRVEYYDQHDIDPETNKLIKKGVKGLALRITKSGSRSFVYRYWYDGRSKRYKIGDYPNKSLTEARDEAKELADLVNEGKDPLAVKKKNQEQQKEQLKTFKYLANEFKDIHLPTLRESTRKEYRRIIDRELIKHLGDTEINKITKAKIMKLLDRKAGGEEPAPVMANRIRARLSKIFEFGKERGLVESNPVKSISKYKKTKNNENVEKRRDRYYSPDEIRELWKYFDNWEEPTGSVLKMLLITAQRKTETMKMKWDHLDGDTWTIPAHLAKNGEPHEVPLSDMALKIIERLRPITGRTDYVFNSPKKDNAPMKWLTRVRVHIQENSKVPDFRPHDLRRTFATYCSKLGVDRTALGKILNHKTLSKDTTITAIYDRHGYEDEKREAMNKWEVVLYGIINEADYRSLQKGVSNDIDLNLLRTAIDEKVSIKKLVAGIVENDVSPERMLQHLLDGGETTVTKIA